MMRSLACLLAALSLPIAAGHASVAAVAPAGAASVDWSLPASDDDLQRSVAGYGFVAQMTLGHIAVYDISAHVVVLPDGSRLEAHSGLGAQADDPLFVRRRMHGATPPALYGLAPRKWLFHGVAALRLTPIAGDVFGRTGLLTHTYMLHGRPESNGCVVFRDYASFLRAFRDGAVQRLRVVPAVGDMAIRGNAA